MQKNNMEKRFYFRQKPLMKTRNLQKYCKNNLLYHNLSLILTYALLPGAVIVTLETTGALWSSATIGTIPFA